MGYAIKDWKDRQSEYPNRRTLTPVAGVANTYEVARAEGIITEGGYPFDQQNMNNLESRVAAAFDQVAAGTIKAGAAAVADTASAVTWGNVTGKPALYTQAEVDGRLSTKANQADLNATNGAVSTKANQSDLNATNGAVAQKATTATYTATIGTAASQNIGVGGMLATDNPMVDVLLSGDKATDTARLDAWKVVSRITTYNGGITVVCYDEAPSVNIPIQMKVVR